MHIKIAELVPGAKVPAERLVESLQLTIRQSALWKSTSKDDLLEDPGPQQGPMDLGRPRTDQERHDQH